MLLTRPARGLITLPDSAFARYRAMMNPFARRSIRFSAAAAALTTSSVCFSTVLIPNYDR